MNEFIARLCALALVASPAAAWSKPAPAAKPAAPAPAPANEVKEVTVTAEAAINANLPAATQKATDQALRRAVEQVVGTYVSSFSEMKEYEMLQDIVATHTTGYVQSYDVVKKDVNEDDDIVAVTLKARVSKGQIDKDAAAISLLMNMKTERRLYVVINDRTVRGVGKGQASENVAVRTGAFDAELRGQLRKDGFLVLDPNLDKGKLTIRSGLQSIQSAGEAVELARATNADVVIYGNVNVLEDEPMLYDQKLGQVSISPELYVVFPSTGEAPGEYTATIVQNETTLDGARRTGIAKATAEATSKLRGLIFDAWRKQLNNGQTIQLSVKGLKNYSAFKEFQSLLSQHVSGVKGLNSARFENGVGSVDLGYNGNGDALATAVGGKPFKGMTIEVTKVAGNLVELALEK